MLTLDSRLEKDTITLGQFPLCLLLLSRDANYPWCILVPKREDVREIHHLNPADREQLLEESCALASLMERLFGADKMNVAALGNMVPQLHIHHVARFKSDAAWPKPIWGAVDASEYSEELLERRAQVLQIALAKENIGFEEL
ncbi:MAG: HIT domain-containing protein [Cellvibrionaceae bacterium]